MDTPETRIYKNAHGNWTAETQVPFPRHDSMVVHISTQKVYSGEVVSRVTVDKIEGAFRTHRMFTDYSEAVERSRVRATEKAVREQHARAVARMDDIMKAAEAHYATNKES